MKVEVGSVYGEWEAAVSGATNDITVFAPYWDDLLLKLLKPAIQKGLRPTIITSDDMIKYVTSKNAFDALGEAWRLSEKGKVRLAELPKLHAKVLMVDGHIVTIGSQNFTKNSRDNMKEISSVYDHGELTVDGQPQELTEWLKASLVTKERLEIIKAFVEKHIGLRRKMRLLEQAQLTANQLWYPINFDDNGRAALENERRFELLFGQLDHDVVRSEWVPVFDERNNFGLYLVRINELTASHSISAFQYEVYIPLRGKGSVEASALVQLTRSVDYNLVVNLTIDFYDHIYRAKVLCDIGFEGREVISCNWDKRQSPPPELVDALDKFASEGDLLSSVMEPSRKVNFLNDKNTIMFGKAFPGASEISVVETYGQPALVVR